VGITVVSGFIGVFIIVEEFLLGDPMGLKATGHGYLGVFVAFLVGLVLISQAITALYISRIHTEAQGRPLFIVDKKRSRNLGGSQKG
jgi:formate hydrogenlyase subunit 3/multisubunit Na+/H+ antiporter MnhD subunit